MIFLVNAVETGFEELSFYVKSCVREGYALLTISFNTAVNEVLKAAVQAGIITAFQLCAYAEDFISIAISAAALKEAFYFIQWS